MKHTEAVKYLNRAERRGYVKYHSGLVMENIPVQWGGNTTGSNWGINIDGDGTIFGGVRHLFGCPQIIWGRDQAEEQFPR